MRLNVDLRDNVARGTKFRYSQSCQALQAWLWECNLPPMGWLASQLPSLINKQYLYDKKRADSHAPCALAAVQQFRRAPHGLLRPAWHFVKAWKFAEPGALRAPILLCVL